MTTVMPANAVATARESLPVGSVGEMCSEKRVQ